MTKKMMPLFITGFFLVMAITIVSAEPTVELNPSQPKPLEKVTFTATIPDVENIEQVIISVQECGNEPDIGYICYTDDFNQTLTETATNTYSGSVTLTHENAIELKYELKYQTTEGWTTYPEDLVKVEYDLSSEPDNADNGDSTDNDADTPGFEVLGLFMSVIFISLILYRHKR
jgi:hypothetical protein